MSEYLTINPVPDPDQEMILEIMSSEPIGGGNEAKHLVQGHLGETAVSLVERTYYSDHVKAWMAFRSVGMPVASELYTNGETSMLVTDVKADGSEVYGKALKLITHKELKDKHTGQPEERTRVRPAIDELFLDLTSPNNRPAIENEAQRLLTVAHEAAGEYVLELPYDDPFELIVHPDGNWGLITLDLRLAEVVSRSRHSPRYLREVMQDNDKNVDTFLEVLWSLHSHFYKQYQAKP